jgi:hypothetical protein
MINWMDYKEGDTLDVEIVEDDSISKVKIKLLPFEYSLHRKPYLSLIQIIESNNVERWGEGYVITLPLVVEEKLTFLVDIKTKCNSHEFISRSGTFKILN